MKSELPPSRFMSGQVIALPDDLEIKLPKAFMFAHDEPDYKTHSVSHKRFNHNMPAESLDGRHVVITSVTPTELGWNVPIPDLFLYNAMLVTRNRALWVPEQPVRKLVIDGNWLTTATLAGKIEPRQIIRPHRALVSTHTPHRQMAYKR